MEASQRIGPGVPQGLGWMQAAAQRGPAATGDLVGALLPLFEQVAECHEQGKVAPLAELRELGLDGGRLWFPAGAAQPPLEQRERLSAAQPEAGALAVVGRYAQSPDGLVSLAVRAPGEPITRPVYCSGWTTWERELGHHDALVDVLLCGQLLGALACGLDLGTGEGLDEFAGLRGNLFARNPELHPVVAKLIVSMTEVDRHRRSQDMRGCAETLRHHRRVVGRPGGAGELPRLGAEEDAPGARNRILGALRERLFEISRRNRLLYFRPTLSAVDLTAASVPVLLDPAHVDPAGLCTWAGIAGRVAAGKALDLVELLRFEEAAYLPGQLDRMRADDRRHRSEYGLSQLRLCPAMLRWHDLKGEAAERITTPLLLLPVALRRTKGVRDRYVLEPAGTVAEVNPVLRHHLANLYGIELPVSVDLAEVALEELHASLEQQILASEPGVTLRRIDRPEIQVVHAAARRRLDQYRRRVGPVERGLRQWGDVGYSYKRSRFVPLGLQLFARRVQPASWTPAGEPALASEPGDGAGMPPTSYSLERVDAGNPYAWDFDLCAVTLGHFHYRRMSLVRDYEQLLAGEVEVGPTFTQLFTDAPREAAAGAEAGAGSLDPEDSMLVVPADPTQAAAVARARGTESFIIQGPPGTGKSQTITNLIADRVAAGGRVLFVCEKRAALDVVFSRLVAHGLGPLCCLIHDSQGDKKAFVHELRDTYAEFLEGGEQRASARGRRTRAVKRVAASAERLRWARDAMVRPAGPDGPPLRRAIGELAGRLGQVPEYDFDEAAGFPGLGALERVEPALRELEGRVADQGRARCWGEHGLRHLHPRHLRGERIVGSAREAVEGCRAAHVELAEALAWLEPGAARMGEVGELFAHAGRLEPFGRHGALALLDPDSELSTELVRFDAERQVLGTAVEQARALTDRWTKPFEERDLADVRDLAERVEGAWYRFLLPGWYGLKRRMAQRYDLAAHDVQPSFRRLLGELSQRYAAEAALAAHVDAAEETFLPVPVEREVAEVVEELRAAAAELPPLAARLHAGALAADGGARVAQLAGAARQYDGWRDGCEQLLRRPHDCAFDGLGQRLGELDAGLGDLPELLPSLEALLEGGGAALLDLASDHPWTVDELRAAVLQASVDGELRSTAELERWGGDELAEVLAELDQQRSKQLEANAALVASEVRARFAENVARASQPGKAEEAGEADWRKRYKRGRKELEHEFGKSMRYSAIRDLAAGDSGMVLRDIKPVWLMSPLSVSDTLPLDDDLFDLVIFDEASQIPLEEAVPALFRADRCVVVGDTMQLPPTDFFSARRPDPELAALGESVGAALASASFLDHADRSLASVRLGWHYRSRSEALIDFSNAAFYGRGLVTIPGTEPMAPRPAICCEDPADMNAEEAARSTLDRAISFHHLPRGVYGARRNAQEARYVAGLVAGLLEAAPELSLGVVAFSEAQAGELEGALEALARERPALRQALDGPDEVEGEPPGEGLFLKNLENVQGDERDIIILSVCYGPDAAGKMRMNFGPINRGGGEKRLNVVFSRARQHMAVVSSIEGERITNDYNDGAQCLKRYLRYAAACSIGDREAAARVLGECSPARAAEDQDAAVDGVTAEVVGWLESEGWSVDRSIGRSGLRVQLAVRAPAETCYRLAIHVDTEAHYGAADVIEQYSHRPGVLRGFGWQQVRVLGVDWLRDASGVQERLRAALGSLPEGEG